MLALARSKKPELLPGLFALTAVMEDMKNRP
jgi:hypothetical protein